MLRKTKLLLGFSSAVTALASAAVPISVSLSNVNFDCPYEEFFKFDDENGFNERWFEQFAASYENTIVSQIIEPSSKSRKWKDVQIQHLKQRIQLYQDKIDDLKREDAVAPMAYTVVSNAMIDDAYDSYVDDFGKHVKIYRSTHQNITFNDITILYEQQKNSVVANMENAGIDNYLIQRLKEDSQKQFDTLFSQLVEQYADPLAAMYKAKSKLAMLFVAANKEVGFIGASQALSDFLSNHSIEFNSNGQNNQLDVLMNSPGKFDEETEQLVKFEKGNDISVFINDIFTIKNNITGRPINFSKLTVVPGFKVYPVLNEIKIDKYTNEHTIEVDWRCVKDCYVGEEGEADATAHLYAPSADAFEQRFSEGESDISVNQMFNNDDAVMMTYDIPLTNAAEIANFREAYLGETQASNKFEVTGLKFKWDESDKCSFDPFVTGTIIQDEETSKNVTVTVDARGLAQSGLMVKAFGPHSIESDWYRLEEIVAPDGYEGCDEVDETQNAVEFSDVDDEIAKSAINKFVKNCSLKGICTFDKSLTQHNVDVQLCAWYGNTKGTNDEERELTKIEIGNFRLENLPFTKVLYHNLTSKYNAMRAEVEQYATCSITNPLYVDLGNEKTSRIVSMCLTIGLSALATGLMFIPTFRPSTKIILGAYLILTAADIAIAGISYGIWKNKIYKPADELHSRVLAFSKTPLCKELMDEINQDGKDYKLVNAKKNINGILEMDKKEYDENFEKNFKHITGEIDYEDLIAFNKKYTSFDTFPRMDEFLNTLYEDKICSWDVKEVSDNCSDNSSYGKTVKTLDLISSSITIAELAVTAIDISITTFMAVRQWVVNRNLMRLAAEAEAEAGRTAQTASTNEEKGIAYLAKMKKEARQFKVPTKLGTIDEIAAESSKELENFGPSYRNAIEQQIATAKSKGEKLTESRALDNALKQTFIKKVNPLVTNKQAANPLSFDHFLTVGIKRRKIQPRVIVDELGNAYQFLLSGSGRYSKYFFEQGMTCITIADYRLVNIPEKFASKVMFSEAFQHGAAQISSTIVKTMERGLSLKLLSLGKEAVLSAFWKSVWRELLVSANGLAASSQGAKFFCSVLLSEFERTGKCLETMTAKELEELFAKATEKMAQNISQGGEKMSFESALVFNRAFSSGISSIGLETYIIRGQQAIFRFINK